MSDDKIYAIAMTAVQCAAHIEENNAAKCFAGMAREIYTAHVKPLEDALAKAEADKAALVAALEDCWTLLAEMGEEHCHEAKQARAALSRVKGDVC